MWVKPDQLKKQHFGSTGKKTSVHFEKKKEYLILNYSQSGFPTEMNIMHIWNVLIILGVIRHTTPHSLILRRFMRALLWSETKIEIGIISWNKRFFFPNEQPSCFCQLTWSVAFLRLSKLYLDAKLNYQTNIVHVNPVHSQA